MSESAHLTSIDVLARFKLAVQQFRQEAGDALGTAQMVVQRYVEWIEHDRVKFWELQIRRGWEKIAEARADLERCQALAMEGERRTCHDEQEALDLAKRRLRRAEEQFEAVRHWRNKLHHEIVEYRARAGQLAGWLETEHPKAEAALARMYAALAAYVAMQAPTAEASGVESGSAARAGDPIASPATAPSPNVASPPAASVASESGEAAPGPPSNQPGEEPSS